MASPLCAHVAAGSLTQTSFSGRTLLVPHSSGQRTQRLALRAYGEGSGASTSTQESPVAGSIKVRVTPPKPLSVPPSPPSLIHSPVYVQNKLIKPSADGAAVLPPASSSGSYGLEDEEELSAAGSSGNVLMSALRNVDRSLDELEQNPLPLQREIYELSRSPVGTATSSALTTAAKVTVAATKEAVKAAVPVGQWVLREGAKAAMGLMSRAMAEAARKQVEGGTGTTKISVKKRPEASGGSSNSSSNSSGKSKAKK
ncbi:hypothetical protein HYH02_013876 [Chlamydomonas schloesseri]|uniref:Uncharacterized protein n=1 Tax=Chlamydomonas schloesseri TaxID=2026947 RepID=A0A835VY95_9CHLO|nr:hypothetical protein HYH02_013876 [Chlamydomonas schloesseri]|eukprot:KAG2430049.1 hypothetical protein HYH02_013876 [Chlamydomonas schloesseri]